VSVFQFTEQGLFVKSPGVSNPTSGGTGEIDSLATVTLRASGGGPASALADQASLERHPTDTGVLAVTQVLAVT